MANFTVIKEPVLKVEYKKVLANGERVFVLDDNGEKVVKEKFIYYVIEFDEPEDGKKVQYRKERGLKNYDISLIRGNALDQKNNARLLIAKISKDLSEGIDPQKALYRRVEKVQTKLIEAKKVEDAKFSLDDAINLLKDEKGYSGGKIAEGREVTAVRYLSLFNNDLRRYLTIINKVDDIRAVTRTDIKDWIELHFNPTDKYLDKNKKRIFNNWTSKSCTTCKASVSSLFSVLLDKDIIPSNPCFGVRIKRDSEKIVIAAPTKDRFELWTQDEMDIFFKYSDDPDHKFYSSVGQCIYYSCIRKAELFRIRVDMVDFANERFSIPARLTKAARKYKNPNELVHIDIPDALITTLRDWIAYKCPDGFNDSSYLFPHRNKIKLQHDYSTFNSEWNRFRESLRAKYAGMFLKNIYALKHNGISTYFHALIKRPDLTPAEITLKVQNFARHSDFTETANYLRNHNLMFVGKREKVNF